VHLLGRETDVGDGGNGVLIGEHRAGCLLHRVTCWRALSRRGAFC
jgi:hypothetical protein